MQPIKMRIAAGMLTLNLLFGVALIYQVAAKDQPARTEVRAADGHKNVTGLSPDDFDTLRTLIKPKPGGFDDLAWMTDLWEARKKADEEGKPLLVWVGDGHPLGWT